MTRVEWVVLRRLGGRIAVTIAVVFGLIALAESVNTWRFQHLSNIGGPLLGLLAIATEAARWALGTLPVTLLIGAIIGLLDLQARRELTVIKAAGWSVWQVLRAPLVGVILFALFASLVGDTAIVTISRMLSINMPEASNSSGVLWLEERGEEFNYVLVAEHPHPGGAVLEGVTVFLAGEQQGSRIIAEAAELRSGSWFIAEGTRYSPDVPPEPVRDFSLPTTTTAGDMGVRLSSPVELTVFELAEVMARRISDPELRHGVEMRFIRVLALPIVLIGSLLIAFAFTAGYRRTNKYGGAVLYGIVLGFVIYVITEMAAMAGGAGVLDPVFAAVAPALVAIVIGTTVLLYKEDGRI